jgi:hypothetical protein
MSDTLLINIAADDIYLLKGHWVYNFGLGPEHQMLGYFENLRIRKAMLDTDL